MKSILHLSAIFMIALLWLVPSCRKDEKGLFRWKPIQPDADSLVIALDRETVLATDPDSWRPLIERLDSVATCFPDIPQLKVRSFYWWAKFYNRRQMPDSVRFWVEKARALADSAAYPYDMARVDLLCDGSISQSIVSDLIRLQKVREYAKSTHDNLLLANTIVIYEHLMANLKDLEEARSIYEEADSLYGSLGLEQLQLWMKVNIGSSYIRDGDSIKADSIMGLLLRHPDIKRDPHLYVKLLYNSGRLRRSPEAMARVAGLAGANGSRDLELTSRWLEGKFYQLRGEVERGDSVYGLLLPRLDECDHFLKADIIYDNSYRLEREGKIDSALMLARWYYAQAETIASFGSIRKISNLDSMERLRRYNEGMEKEKRRERLYWIIGAVLLAVIAIFGYRKMRQKVRRERSRKAEAIREMENQVALVERGNRELTSIGLVMTEKDNVLQTLMERISDMEHKQRITREEARYLDSTIRLHRGRQQEWEHFKEIYTELSTDFPDRLRTTYPDLTEGDIKMAMYIRVGMNSRQIANMLNIRPESVKMNRIRLRKRMHLSPDDSLEEVLSRVSSESK